MIATKKYGSDINLQELRRQLTTNVALASMIAGAVSIWFGMLGWLAQQANNRAAPFPLALMGLLVLLLGLGRVAWVCAKERPALARHLLAWGLTAIVLIAMGLLPAPWIPFLGVILAFTNALLVSGGGLVAAAAIAALAAQLASSGIRAYPSSELLWMLALSTVLAWLIVRTLYTALDWAWNMQQRADRLLELARDRQGELASALKSLEVNNTLLRRTQRELIIARRQAEETQLVKEQFAANVSHELRTPLNLILGFSEVMYLSPEVYGDMEWPPRLRRATYQIYRNSRHLLEMIDEILDLSRFEIVEFMLDKEPTPLGPLLQDTIEIAANLFPGGKVQLEADIAPDLPTLEIDRTRVRQVLLNLLGNASRFTEEGIVRVEARHGEGEVVISVTDTGPGISADDLARVFEPFYQGDQSLRRKHGGTGLGLAISRRFVEAHNGRIWAESEEGAGSTFAFSLPVPGGRAPFSRLQENRPPQLSPSKTRPPILVLDADPAVASLIRRHTQGHGVILVKDARQLEEAVRQHHPQAVIRNVPPPVEKPGGEGITFESVPFIECSLPSQAWVAEELAVAGFLSKPLTTQQLMHEVEKLGTIRDVLVVDDDRGFCQLAEQMLEAAGKELVVRHAYGGEEGLLALRTRRPDLVLLDLFMPHTDGFQVLEEIRQEPELADLPVLLLTASSYFEDILTQRGGRVVIQRPSGLTPMETLQCVQAALDLLEPRYDERSAPEQALIPHPPGEVPPAPHPG